MELSLLQNAVQEIKNNIYHAVVNAKFGQSVYENGLKAKTALIRSEKLIQKIHEITKISLYEEISRHKIKHQIHPPIGYDSPELDVWGLLKKKQQDIVILFSPSNREKIDQGPMKGQYDELGTKAAKQAVVIGVRSQLSSIDKNFDTLMERAFAETLNLRLKHPELVMGEVYLLAVREYDSQEMKKNKIAWKYRFTKAEKFISIFNAMSNRKDYQNTSELYKYERSALILADFSRNPVKIYKDMEELKKDSVVSKNFPENYSKLSPVNFSKDIIDTYMKRHGLF
ncbi:Uncharacterized protein dnl_56830 [Desulfonema limicola]|uniref:Uncharacterized protein n=1 Tax=Desulfonema limicola TaxID=45656 RepID=A0A975BDJ3_9BACT|nr:hypothetical protein [Desulfonema limicola]QTA83285.1 Uncharacterized protein dnl_56830 [Desulfonema limicola]